MNATAAMPTPPGYTANLKNPTDVIHTTNIVTQVLTLCFVSLFVGIRLISRYKVARFDFAIDDYFTFLAWLLMVPYCICGIFLSVYGGGYHAWEVPKTSIQSFHKVAYAATIFYAPMALFVKLSLLTIITRIFAPYHKTIVSIYTLEGLLVAYYLSQLVVKIRICWPISAYWEGDASRCLEQAAIIMADSIISVISDAVILLLPLPLTWSLQMSRKKKLRVAGMLGIGGLAVGFSVWRLHLIVTEGKSPDQTVVFTEVVISGNAEAGIGIICTCLPATAGLLHRAPQVTGYGYSSQRNTPQNSKNHTSSSNNNHSSSKNRNSYTTKPYITKPYRLSAISNSRVAKSPEPASDEAGLVAQAQQGDDESSGSASRGRASGTNRRQGTWYAGSEVSSSKEVGAKDAGDRESTFGDGGSWA